MIAPPVVRPPICVGCALYDGERCEAFGDVPPEPILWSEADHRQPFQGDGGRQFTAVAPWAARYAASTFEVEPDDSPTVTVQPLAEFAYSPSQPRKSDGKFGTGGRGVSPVTPRSGGMDDAADAAGLGIDDRVRQQFTGEHAAGIGAAIDRVNGRFPGALKGATVYAETQEVMDSRFGKGTAAATSMDGKRVMISDDAAKVPAFYDPKGDHSHSAGGDTTEGVLTHELMHVALDKGGAWALRTAPYDAYALAKSLPVPTRYAKGDRGDGRERAAELMTQGEFGQPGDGRGFLDTVAESYSHKPKAGGAVAPTVEEFAYSPSQPRKSDGKFGTGGGSAAPSSPRTERDNGGPGVAGITQEGWNGAAKIAYGFKAESDKSTSKDVVAARKQASERLKDEAMRKVGADLDAQFDQERLKLAARSMAAGRRSDEQTQGERVADSVMESWSDTAFDENHAGSMAVQRAIADEFGTGVPSYIDKAMARVQPTVRSEYEARDQEVLRATVRSMYKHTQARLDELGVGPTVGLVRGVGPGSRFSGEKGIDLNPASSWSTDENIARQFGQAGEAKPGAWLSMTVPRSRILAMPGSGPGSFQESEVIVLRGKGDRADGTPL